MQLYSSESIAEVSIVLLCAIVGMNESLLCLGLTSPLSHSHSFKGEFFPTGIIQRAPHVRHMTCVVNEMHTGIDRNPYKRLFPHTECFCCKHTPNYTKTHPDMIAQTNNAHTFNTDSNSTLLH